MKATMTDVQKAIEQLGRTNGDTDRDDKDGRRSFSFTTVSREETDTEEEHLDENWAKGARKRLAEVVAQGAMSMDYDAEKMEIERRLKPPIDVELSDESEGEEEEPQGNSNSRPALLEGGGATRDANAGDGAPLATPIPRFTDSPASSEPGGAMNTGTPSPGTSIVAPPTAANGHGNANNQDWESRGPKSLVTPVVSPSSTANGNGNVKTLSNGRRANAHPTEWTLEEVLDWLKSKGFDQEVCDKFAGMFLHATPT